MGIVLMSLMAKILVLEVMMIYQTLVAMRFVTAKLTSNFVYTEPWDLKGVQIVACTVALNSSKCVAANL